MWNFEPGLGSFGQVKTESLYDEGLMLKSAGVPWGSLTKITWLASSRWQHPWSPPIGLKLYRTTATTGVDLAKGSIDRRGSMGNCAPDIIQTVCYFLKNLYDAVFLIHIYLYSIAGWLIHGLTEAAWSNLRFGTNKQMGYIKINGVQMMTIINNTIYWLWNEKLPKRNHYQVAFFIIDAVYLKSYIINNELSVSWL